MVEYGRKAIHNIKNRLINSRGRSTLRIRRNIEWWATQTNPMVQNVSA